MINVVLNMPGTMYQKSIGEVLRKADGFRVFMEESGNPEIIVAGCAAHRADILIMQVSLQNDTGHANRERAASLVRARLPGCRIVVLLDEHVSEVLTERVKQMKQVRVIDQFVYTSCSMTYLVDLLQTIV